MAVKFNCHACGAELTFPDLVGRRDECWKCRADAHVCKNCRNYDPKAYNECREPQADRVQEKDRANFCDFFTPKAEGGPGAETDRAKDLRAAAEALFKKK